MDAHMNKELSMSVGFGGFRHAAHCSTAHRALQCQQEGPCWNHLVCTTTDNPTSVILRVSKGMRPRPAPCNPIARRKCNPSLCTRETGRPRHLVGITAAPAFMFGGRIHAEIWPVMEGFIPLLFRETSAVVKAGLRRHSHSEQPASDTALSPKSHRDRPPRLDKAMERHPQGYPAE